MSWHPGWRSVRTREDGRMARWRRKGRQVMCYSYSDHLHVNSAASTHLCKHLVIFHSLNNRYCVYSALPPRSCIQSTEGYSHCSGQYGIQHCGGYPSSPAEREDRSSGNHYDAQGLCTPTERSILHTVLYPRR